MATASLDVRAIETAPENASRAAGNASRRLPDEKRGHQDDLTPCTYCGLPADSQDHVRPRVVSAMIAGGLPSPTPLANRTVPACRECNSALGDRVYPTLAARRRAIRAYLMRRYRRVLESPTWTSEELAELDPSLRAFVEANARLRAVTLERLAWAGQRSVRRAARPFDSARDADAPSSPAGRGRGTVRRGVGRVRIVRADETGRRTPIYCQRCGWDLSMETYDPQPGHCVVCGKPLTGRQEAYCSGRCRTRACRARKAEAR